MAADQAALVPMRGRVHRKLTVNQSKRQSLAWQEFLYTGEKGTAEINAAREATPAAPSPRAPSQRREAPILKDILRMMRTHPLVEEVSRQQAGQIPVAGGYIRLGNKGKLDIAFRLKDGRYGEIEVKAPGKRPMPHQQARIEYLQSTGAVAGWATSVQEAASIITGEQNV